MGTRLLFETRLVLEVLRYQHMQYLYEEIAPMLLIVKLE